MSQLIKQVASNIELNKMKKRWGMVIDLSRCIRCNACTIACQQENGVPPDIFYTRVLSRETGEYPKVKTIFLPVLCNHCEDPPCEEVCPSGATYIREDGLVLIDSDKCIGCRACYVACPYKNRFYLSRSRNRSGGYYGKSLSVLEERQYKQFTPGTSVKCTMCSHRLDEGLEPACVVACPSEARIFGDLNDPNSKVIDLISRKTGIQLLRELNTSPSVYYVGA